MSKFTRSTLAKGVRLTRQMFTTPLKAVGSAFQYLQMGRENLQQPNAPFRVNVTVPLLDARYFQVAPIRPDANQFVVPFCLPPLQEDWDTNANPPVLDEFMFSFDQAGEPAAIASVLQEPTPGTQTGKLNYDGTNCYDITISLVEKSQMIRGAKAPWTPEREVMSVHLTPPVFAGSGLNPFIIRDLQKAMDPTKTYCIVMTCPKMSQLLDQTNDSAMPSLVFSFRFRSPIVARDWGGDIQNLPVSHLGTKTPETITIVDPATGSTINAETTTSGIHNSVAKLDQRLHGKLDAGYTRDSNLPPLEHLSVESCYDVLVVPVWGGFGATNALTTETAGQAPYVGAAPFVGPTGDARYIRLSYPFTIHHVMAVVNYQNPRHTEPYGLGAHFPPHADRLTKPLHPSSDTLLQKVGVGIGTIMGSDEYAYQHVAYLEWLKSTKAAKTIDRIKNTVGGVDSEDALEPWDLELLSVPMVYRTGKEGKGFLLQGKPFFVGRSTSRTRARTLVGTMVGGSNVPVTQGQETMLEVRWTLEDSTGLNPAGGELKLDHAPVDTFGTFGVPLTKHRVALMQLPGQDGYPNNTFTMQAGEPTPLSSPGGHSGWWDWQAPASGPATVSTFGTDHATLLGVYTGNAVNALTAKLVVVGGDNPGDYCIGTFQAVQGTLYRIAVNGKAGATGMVKLQIDQPYRQDEVLVGQGGNFVILIGKKTLVQPQGDLEV